VALEKDGEDQLGRFCEKWRLVTYSQGDEYPKSNKRGRVSRPVTYFVGTAFVKHVIDSKIEEGIWVKRRRRGRRKYLLDGFKEMRRYWKLKEKALYCKFLRTIFGSGCGPEEFVQVICKKKKVKVKWSSYRPGVTQRVGRGIALFFHYRGNRRGWLVSSTPRPHFTPGKDPVPILQEAGRTLRLVWTGGKSRPHRDPIPDHPAHSQSLYRLGYAAHTSSVYVCISISNEGLGPDIQWLFSSSSKNYLMIEKGHKKISSANLMQCSFYKR
jgi:hypothetical protein